MYLSDYESRVEDVIVEDFSGKLFSSYVSGDFRMTNTEKVNLYFSTGAGIYVYVGEVERVEDNTILQDEEEGETDFSGSEIRFGMNTGFMIKVPISDRIDLKTEAKYHYTWYDYGRKILTLTTGLNYRL